MKKQVGYFTVPYTGLRWNSIGMFHEPSENNFTNFPNLYIIFTTFMMIYGGTLTIFEMVAAYRLLITVSNTRFDIFYIIAPGIHITAFFKISILILKNKNLQKIGKMLEYDTKKFNGDQTIVNKMIFISKFATYCFLILCYTTIFLLCLYTIITDYNMNQENILLNNTLKFTRQTPFPIYTPWNRDTNLIYYITVIYSTIGVCWMANCVMFGDSLMCTFLLHISAHFQMIAKKIENLGEDTLEVLENKLNKLTRKENKVLLKLQVKKKDRIFLYDEWSNDQIYNLKKKILMHYFTENDFNVAMMYCLKNLIRYHQLIIKITNELHGAYSFGFLSQTFFSFFIIGLVLVQAALNTNDMRLLSNSIFLITVLWQLFIQTYSANEVTLNAAKIADSIFGSPWYNAEYDNGERGHLLRFFILRAQTPIYITAGYFTPMNNQLFVTVVRRSYQIFTLIYSTISAEKGTKIKL